MQIDKVLVPMDFSPTARVALNHGIAFARKFRARLTLLHVVESGSALTYTFPTEAARMEQDHVEQARRMLSTLIASEDENDLDLRALVKVGDVEDRILSTIEEEGIDIVVMGAHGRGLLGRFLIGSVAEKVLRKVEVPVMTVSRAGRFPAFDRILFATDLSAASREGLHYARELAHSTNARLIALHAVDVGIDGGAEAAVYLGESRLDEARAKLEELKAEAPQQTIEVEAVTAEKTLPETILKAAEDNSADIVAITVQNKGWFERAVLGSTVDAIIREADIPVLSIPIRNETKRRQRPEASAA